MMTELFSDIEASKNAYLEFINNCSNKDGLYSLTPNAEPSAYALCFAIFGFYLLGDTETIEQNKLKWDFTLREQLLLTKKERQIKSYLNRDKPYLQLLTFTLSALSVLGTLKQDPLSEHVLPLIPDDLKEEFQDTGVLDGVPRTGNYAMFLGVILIHARDYLGQETGGLIEQWTQLHVQAMNKFGFWGSNDSMSHLQFQNGYHQYEFLEYMQVESVSWTHAATAVASLADSEGHFAPYPGGGGCYDYDALFILTGAGKKTVRKYSDLLMHTAKTILSEQNDDGGFCESIYVRPRTFSNVMRSLKHVISGRGAARTERLKYSITLLRPKHNRIHTHWSKYSRRWNESDLWDSWFRMLAVAKIDVALNPKRISEWGFINYPGIGYHSALASEPRN